MPSLTKISLSLLLCAALTACAPNEVDRPLFEDITSASGLAGYEGMTHGAAWGDYDGDGRPDLYLTNHLQPARLFRNLGGGRFADVTADVLGEQTGGDKHGAAWADFDNDGDQDLVQLTGAVQGLGEEPKRLFVNAGGKLIDKAADLGVSNLPGRTRTPLWVDLDGDGRLDLFQGAEARFDEQTPPFLFVQGTTGFLDRTAWLTLQSRSAPFCVLFMLDDDRHAEIVCRLMGQGTPVQVFDTSTQPARTLEVLPKTAFEDAAVADFDHDGRLDLFLARKNPGGRVSLARNGRHIVTAQAEIGPAAANKESGFRFRAGGSLRVTVGGMHAGEVLAGDVRLGKTGAQPGETTFAIGADQGEGMPPVPEGDRPAVLIGSPAPGVWQVVFHVPQAAFAGRKKPKNLTVRIATQSPIEDLQGLADSVADETAPQRLFMNRDGRLVEEGDKRGVNARPIAATNVIAADFDNDMHVDLFILGSNDAGKAENLLLLNDGKGRFRVVKNAGGAAGALSGVGDSVTSADIDGDGCLDILTASGASMGRSLGMPSDNGRYQIFRNLCKTGNHWLMLDLQGTRSNRDGIGARVVVEAGGVGQTRLQGGGVHERGQNHARLHFGLGKHTRAEKITVYWPSGKVQTLGAIPANQILRVKEPD